MRFAPALLAATILAACTEAGDTSAVDPPTIGERRALEDAQEMIEQHGRPASAADEQASSREKEPAE